MAEIKFKIDNLTDNEHMLMYPFLSRENIHRAQQIKFFNSQVPLRFFDKGEPPGGGQNSDFITSSVIYEDELARLIYEYKRIQILASLIAKTNIALQGYFEQTTDTLGSTIINTLERLINYAEDSLNTEVDKENRPDAINSIRTFIDRTASPCNAWASKKLNSLSEKFVTDLYDYNRLLCRQKTINSPGEHFNSIRHITYHILDILPELIKYTHEFFVTLIEDIISLKQVVIGAVSATRNYLIDLDTILTPPGNISAIADATREVVDKVDESIREFIKQTDINNTIARISAGDPELLPTITAIATSTTDFVGTGTRSFNRKYIIKDYTPDLLNTLYNYSIRFSLSTSYHYRPYVSTLSVMPFMVFKRILPDSYYPSAVKPKDITVDIYGNRLKYLEYIIPLLFKKKEDKSAPAEENNNTPTSEDISSNNTTN